MSVKKNKRYIFIFTLLILIQSVLIWVHMLKKDALSVDEVYSYSLSNSSCGLLFPSKILIPSNQYDIWNKWIPGKVFKDYLTTSPHNSFNYRNVYENQTQDTHPPLYYYLIHTICSFFPEELSKWQGLSLNLVLFIITQLLLFQVSKNIFKSNKLALLVCLLFGFSNASIDNFVYISFNSLLTLFNLLLLNFFIKNIDNNNFSIKKFLEFFLIVVSGGFTHYLFLLYTIAIIIVFSIIAYYKKSYNSLSFTICSFLVCITALYLLFPEMIQQISISFNTSEILSGINPIIPGIGFISNFIRKFFSVPDPYYSYLTTFLIIFFFSYGCWKLIDHYYPNKPSILLTAIPIIIVFSLQSLYMNYEYFNYNYIKYFFSYYPIIAIILLLVFKQFNKPYILILLVLFTFISSCINLNYKVLNDFNNNSLTIENTLKANNAILVFNNFQDIQIMAPYLQLCDKVYLLPIDKQSLAETNFSQLPSTGKKYMILTSNVAYSGNNYPVILSNYISNEKVDIYEITDKK